jgi:DNA-directed RNA polymerase II subunit RPB2
MENSPKDEVKEAEIRPATIPKACDISPHDKRAVGRGGTRALGVRVADVFFKSKSLVAHHIESYANFVQTTIPDTITETVPFDYENEQYRFVYNYDNIYLGPPAVIEHDGSVTDLWPNQARLRDLTYAAPLFAQVSKSLTRKLLNDTISGDENVFVGMLPIMIKSCACRLHNMNEEQLIKANECSYENGGYFIVKGDEKVLMGMERMCTDHVYVFPNKHDPEDLYAEVSSLEERAKKAPSQFSIHVLPSNMLGKKSLRACLSYFKKEFPLGVLFKALGVTEGIKEMILKHFLFTKLRPLQKRQMEELIDVVEEESFHIADQEAAYTALAKIGTTHISGDDKGVMYVEAVLEKEFLPRIGIDKSAFELKVNFLCHMVQKLLQVLFGLRPHDDHDHEKNKRSDTSGPLLATIFRQSWGKINRELQILIRKKMDGGAALKDIMLSQLINTLSLSKDIGNALATGNWSAVRNSRMKTGVSQPLNRFNRQAALSHCRRVINPMPKNSVLSKPRMVHSSMWGVTCPFESPEGPGIGLVKNMALMCCISVGFPDIWIVEIIHALNLGKELSEQTPWIIFVNGKIQGYGESPIAYEMIRNMKLAGTLPMYTSISIDKINREIYVWTDSGRKCRPLLVVEDGKVRMDEAYLKLMESGEKTWEEAIGDGMIEMVDGAEQENLLIAVKLIDLERDGLKYTHAEMSDAFIIGTCASIIPYGNSDPAARLVYQSSMSKQAASVATTNVNQRMDGMNHVLWYPQKPICQTIQMDQMNYNDLPAGQNCVIALITNGGWNCEDGIVVNQDSLDRGLFRETFYRTYKEGESRVTGQEETFGRPPGETGTDKLDLDGLAKMNVRVYEGHMLMGKTCNGLDADQKPIKPSNTFIRHGEHGIVDSVMISQNLDGGRTAKVMVRQERKLNVGDKLAAPHSQKSIVSICRRGIDLPFCSSTGIIPDIFINPASQPSRMTIGHMKEIRAGKYGAANGVFPDATMFQYSKAENRQIQENIAKGLMEQGYEPSGWEVMSDGTTGEVMNARIFVGVCYYQRLKHMVQDKMHVRSSGGRVDPMTKQPNAGRSRDGGLKIGCMERDIMISLGGAFATQQRLRDLSDKYKQCVCLNPECGLIPIANPEKKIWVCRACKTKKIGWIWLPCSMKLLIQQLYAAQLAPRLMTEEMPKVMELLADE